MLKWTNVWLGLKSVLTIVVCSRSQALMKQLDFVWIYKQTSGLSFCPLKIPDHRDECPELMKKINWWFTALHIPSGQKFLQNTLFLSRPLLRYPRCWDIHKMRKKMENVNETEDTTATSLETKNISVTTKSEAGILLGRRLGSSLIMAGAEGNCHLRHWQHTHLRKATRWRKATSMFPGKYTASWCG